MEVLAPTRGLSQMQQGSCGVHPRRQNEDQRTPAGGFLHNLETVAKGVKQVHSCQDSSDKGSHLRQALSARGPNTNQQHVAPELTDHTYYTEAIVDPETQQFQRWLGSKEVMGRHVEVVQKPQQAFPTCCTSRAFRRAPPMEIECCAWLTNILGETLVRINIYHQEEATDVPTIGISLNDKKRLDLFYEELLAGGPRDLTDFVSVLFKVQRYDLLQGEISAGMIERALQLFTDLLPVPKKKVALQHDVTVNHHLLEPHPLPVQHLTHILHLLLMSSLAGLFLWRTMRGCSSFLKNCPSSIWFHSLKLFLSNSSRI
ncbi:hypothetical protein EYF80_013007 [Liparis tanakae]|uniref:Uncharacterized protein n=1 Tax=Liparis tanakae TaxID=230148 RepID=A0A4Z2IFN0_9TELE|nr:hypothetical protein EYF80_013007 [Liparis tanakae]